MRGVTTARPPIIRSETGSMLFVDCPLCETAAPFDLDRDAIDCPACDASLELAPDVAAQDLAIAA
jgi:hypothetical protein